MRKIIHIDMDAFYAAVEQRDNPALRGKPVIVGGSAKERGVVATCSYEARKFGVHSAMATATAMRLCPSAILVRPDFTKYTKASEQIRAIFHEYTDLVEPLSLDEAYLDVTEASAVYGSATQIAKEIKEKIFKTTKLTASAGVSYCKFLAKIASGMKKPDGLTVVTPDKAQDFIDKLPIGSFHGVGKVTEKYMNSLGIKTGFDLRNKTLQFLNANFKSSGQWFYDLARGIDDTPVEPNRERKSIGREVTLPEDILDMQQIRDILAELCVEVEEDMEQEEKKARTVTLKVKYFDFAQVTRSVSLSEPVYSALDIYGHVLELLKKTEAGTKKIRLLGVSTHNFNEPPVSQLKLPLV